MLVGDDDIRFGVNRYETVFPMEKLDDGSPWGCIVRTASLLANITTPNSDITDVQGLAAEDQLIRQLAVLVWVRYCGTVPVNITAKMSDWHSFNLTMIVMMLMPEAQLTVGLNNSTDTGGSYLLDVGAVRLGGPPRSRLALASNLMPVNERYVWDSPTGSPFWNVQGLRHYLQDSARVWCKQNESRLMSVKDIISLLEAGLGVFYADADKWAQALTDVLTVCGESEEN